MSMRQSKTRRLTFGQIKVADTDCLSEPKILLHGTRSRNKFESRVRSRCGIKHLVNHWYHEMDGKTWMDFLVLLLHLALLRKGHQEVAIHIMACIEQKNNSRLVYDQAHPEIDHSAFKKCNLTEFHQDAMDAILINVIES